MAFVQLEGVGGQIEVVFFSKAWGASQRVINMEQPVLLTGILEKADDGNKVKAQSVELLSDVRERLSREAVITVKDVDLGLKRIRALKDALAAHPGRCPVKVVVDVEPEMSVELLIPKFAVNPGTQIRDVVDRLFGRRNVLEYR